MDMNNCAGMNGNQCTGMYDKQSGQKISMGEWNQRYGNDKATPDFANMLGGGASLQANGGGFDTKDLLGVVIKLLSGKSGGSSNDSLSALSGLLKQQ